MQTFANILVGVDLARCNPLDISGLNPIALEPIHWGISVAKANAARLLFFSAIHISEDDLYALAEEDRRKSARPFFRAAAKCWRPWF